MATSREVVSTVPSRDPVSAVGSRDAVLVTSRDVLALRLNHVAVSSRDIMQASQGFSMLSLPKDSQKSIAQETESKVQQEVEEQEVEEQQKVEEQQEVGHLDIGEKSRG